MANEGNAKHEAKAFARWLSDRRGTLSMGSLMAAERVRMRLDALAHGGAESAALRTKAMADIEALCAELGIVTG